MNPRFPASSPRPCGYHKTTIVPLGLAVRKVCPSPLLSRFKRGCIGNRKQKRPSVLEIAITSVTCPFLKSGFPSPEGCENKGWSPDCALGPTLTHKNKGFAFSLSLSISYSHTLSHVQTYIYIHISYFITYITYIHLHST